MSLVFSPNGNLNDLNEFLQPYDIICLAAVDELTEIHEFRELECKFIRLAKIYLYTLDTWIIIKTHIIILLAIFLTKK